MEIYSHNLEDHSLSSFNLGGTPSLADDSNQPYLDSIFSSVRAECMKSRRPLFLIIVSRGFKLDDQMKKTLNAVSG